MTVGYLLSPIDLIPDFIPVLGLLDDLIIVPLLIKTTLRLIPTSVIEDIKTKIDSKEKLPRKWFYAIPVIVLYVYILFVFSTLTSVASFLTYAIEQKYKKNSAKKRYL